VSDSTDAGTGRVPSPRRRAITGDTSTSTGSAAAALALSHGDPRRSEGGHRERGDGEGTDAPQCPSPGCVGRRRSSRPAPVLKISRDRSRGFSFPEKHEARGLRTGARVKHRLDRRLHARIVRISMTRRFQLTAFRRGIVGNRLGSPWPIELQASRIDATRGQVVEHRLRTTIPTASGCSIAAPRCRVAFDQRRGERHVAHELHEALEAPRSTRAQLALSKSNSSFSVCSSGQPTLSTFAPAGVFGHLSASSQTPSPSMSEHLPAAAGRRRRRGAASTGGAAGAGSDGEADGVHERVDLDVPDVEVAEAETRTLASVSMSIQRTAA